MYWRSSILEPDVSAGHGPRGARVVVLFLAALSCAGCGQRGEAPRSYEPPQCYRFDDNLGKAAKVDAAACRPMLEGGSVPLSGPPDLSWKPDKPVSTCEVHGASLVFKAQDPDSITSPDYLGIEGDSIDTILLRARLTGVDQFALSWRARGGDWSEDYRTVRIHAAEDQRMATYQVRTSGLVGWHHRVIDQLRVSLDQQGEIELAAISLLTDRAWLFQRSAGTGKTVIGGHARPCLYAHCPATFEYQVDLPNRAVFSAGLGILDAAPPVRFSLTVLADGRTDTVLATEVRDRRDWLDVTADLGRYLGRSVRIMLAVTAAQGNQVAFWSNPCVRQATGTSRNAARPPNVLLYLIDAVRADHLDAYGYTRQTAPYIKTFAREGVQFSRCYSQDTWTRPSITSLMTGVDSFVHGNVRYGEILPDALVLLPELLRRTGYVTAIDSENPHDPVSTNPRADYCHIETPYLRPGASPNEQELNMAWGELSAITYQRIAAFLDQHKDLPFFLSVHTMECHYAPPTREIPVPHYDPPEPYRSMFLAKPKPAAMDVYDGAIRYADENFRRVLLKLDDLGLSRDTLVILLADHGEGFDPARWQGHNGIPYVELLHIPLILRWPGVLPGNAIVEENVQLLDIAPTIMDYLGLPREVQFEGFSLKPLIESRQGDQFAQRDIFSTWNNMFSAIQGPWKLLQVPRDNANRLCNLRQDPAETQDVARQHPEVLQ